MIRGKFPGCIRHGFRGLRICCSNRPRCCACCAGDACHCAAASLSRCLLPCVPLRACVHTHRRGIFFVGSVGARADSGCGGGYLRQRLCLHPRRTSLTLGSGSAPLTPPLSSACPIFASVDAACLLALPVHLHARLLAHYSGTMNRHHHVIMLSCYRAIVLSCWLGPQHRYALPTLTVQCTTCHFVLAYVLAWWGGCSLGGRISQGD